MQWVDVFGPPGVGKSTLLDEWWPPRGIPRREPPYPAEWAEFIAGAESLLGRVRHHLSFSACKSMTHRSFTKMNAVARRDDGRIYIQTGFAQRGLGIGWRLDDPEEVRPYFEHMPVSVGVVSLIADVDTIQRRNESRFPPKNRAFMVPAMERPMEIAVDVLRERGVPVLEIDTRDSVRDSQRRILDFARSAQSSHA